MLYGLRCLIRVIAVPTSRIRVWHKRPAAPRQRIPGEWAAKRYRTRPHCRFSCGLPWRGITGISQKFVAGPSLLFRPLSGNALAGVLDANAVEWTLTNLNQSEIPAELKSLWHGRNQSSPRIVSVYTLTNRWKFLPNASSWLQPLPINGLSDYSRNGRECHRS